MEITAATSQVAISNLSYLVVKAWRRVTESFNMFGHFSILFLTLFLSYGVNGDSKIIGGQPVTDIRTRAYHAAIEMIGIDSQICSAAIISSEWAVTSGKCVALLLPIDIQLRVGTVRNAYDGDVYEISEVVQHPYFEQVWFTSLDYDVGVVRTSSPIQFSPTVKAIGLPLREAELATGTQVTVSGWGAITADEDGFPPRTLQVGSMEMLSRPACNITQQYIGNITTRMICAGSSGQDVCVGDNGGPLVVGNTAYGVVSWGIGCGVIEFLSVFTNLANSEIRDFITETTGL